MSDTPHPNLSVKPLDLEGMKDELESLKKKISRPTEMELSNAGNPKVDFGRDLDNLIKLHRRHNTGLVLSDMLGILTYAIQCESFHTIIKEVRKMDSRRGI